MDATYYKEVIQARTRLVNRIIDAIGDHPDGLNILDRILNARRNLSDAKRRGKNKRLKTV